MKRLLFISLLLLAGCNSDKASRKVDEVKDDALLDAQERLERLMDRDKPDVEEIEDDIDPALIHGKIGSCQDQGVLSWPKEYPDFNMVKRGTQLYPEGVDPSGKPTGNTADLFATVYVFWWVGDHLEGRSYEHMRKSLGHRGTDFGNVPIESGDEVFTMLSALNRDKSHINKEVREHPWRTPLRRLKLVGPLQEHE